MKNQVRELRREKGLTQEQLGNLVGVSRQAIIAVEAGQFEPSIWLAYELAQVFNRKIEEVFFFEKSVKKSKRGRRPQNGNSANQTVSR